MVRRLACSQQGESSGSGIRIRTSQPALLSGAAVLYTVNGALWNCAIFVTFVRCNSESSRLMCERGAVKGLVRENIRTCTLRQQPFSVTKVYGYYLVCHKDLQKIKSRGPFLSITAGTKNECETQTNERSC
jgi:hypothetical protein